MAADIINLRQARKAKARDEKDKQAELNRVQFGRSKAEKQLTRSRNALEQSRLDAHKKDDRS